MKARYGAAQEAESEKLLTQLAEDLSALGIKQQPGEPMSVHIERGVRHPYQTLVYGHVGLEDRRAELVESLRQDFGALVRLGAVRFVWRKQPAFEVSERLAADGEGRLNPNEVEQRRTLIRARLVAFTADDKLVTLPPRNTSYLPDAMPVQADSALEQPKEPQPDVTERDVVVASDDAVLLCAYVCHEAVRALNDAHNETTLPWEINRASMVAGVRRIILNPNETHAQNHEAWMRYKAEEGWVYGPQKDAERKTHPCMVPFDALPPVQRAKDMIFSNIVRTFFGLRPARPDTRCGGCGVQEGELHRAGCPQLPSTGGAV